MSKGVPLTEDETREAAVKLIECAESATGHSTHASAVEVFAVASSSYVASHILHTGDHSVIDMFINAFSGALMQHLVNGQDMVATGELVIPGMRGNRAN